MFRFAILFCWLWLRCWYFDFAWIFAKTDKKRPATRKKSAQKQFLNWCAVMLAQIKRCNVPPNRLNMGARHFLLCV